MIHIRKDGERWLNGINFHRVYDGGFQIVLRVGSFGMYWRRRGDSEGQKNKFGAMLRAFT